MAYSLHQHPPDEPAEFSWMLKSGPAPGTKEFHQLLTVMSFYREAELHGARLLLLMHQHLRDPDSQMKLTRHLADESRHALLWTKRIVEMGGSPLAILDGYQHRLGRRVGVLKDIIDLLALTSIAESRALERYRNHAQQESVDSKTLEVLKAVTGDEEWHLGWVNAKIDEIAEQRGDKGRATRALEKLSAIEREVYATFMAEEAELIALPSV
jgi:bacterioferritin (cytochrome b1)